MSIQVEWDDDEKSIIRYKFYPSWTIEEFYFAFDKPREMIVESGTKLLGIIVDGTGDSMPPPDATLAFSYALREASLPLVVVNISPATHILLDAVRASSKTKRPVFFAESLAQARKILQAYLESQENLSDYS